MENKNNIDEILTLGYELLQKGDLKSAEQTYLEGLKIHKDNLALINNLAQCYLMKGDVKKSRIYTQKLIRLCEGSTSEEILMLKANSQMKINNLTDALESYEKVLNYNPKNLAALFQIAAIYTEKEEFERSNRYLDEILKNDEENVVALINKGSNFSRLDDYENALDCYEKALEISPKHEVAIRLKGETLQKSGDVKALKKHIKNTLRINPNSAYTLMLKAMECANEENDKKAIEFFNRAISIDPYLDEAYFNKAGFLMHKKRYDEAIECYKKAFEINPESGGITDKEGLFELLYQMKNACQSQ